MNAEHNSKPEANTVSNYNVNTHADADADADAEINLAETKDSVSDKPDAASGVSRDTLLNISTEDDPYPAK